ncbi:MAG: HAMP domain-containing histidine kinase [Alphaproteobacteria bacterium]|nr:HAMP domain-containing histidine kinase [Alphaproteobacteria bacterium]
MKQPSRRVRSMIMRTFVGALVCSFAVFALMVVLFGFTLEDDIFELQVREATANFLRDNPVVKSDHGSLPGVKMTYYVGTEAMPEWLRTKIKPTYKDRAFEVFGGDNGHFHALAQTMPDGRNFYVFFNARRFVRSTPEIKSFLMVIGGMAGLGLVLSLYFLTRMSRKVSRPLEEMANMLADGENVDGRLAVPAQAPRELHALAEAIEIRDQRIQVLLERERQFNRDASHELRTPLAVAFGAVEVLEEKQDASAALTRVKAAIKDMQQLTEGILWLGRDARDAQGCDIKAVCEHSVAAYRHLIGSRNVTVSVKGEERVKMPVPEAVAHVLVGNVLRNALSYTDSGAVTVSVSEGLVEIVDTGIGFGGVDVERRGFGVGLTLVERLSTHFGISFDVRSRPEGGTKVVLSWAEPV